MNYVQFHIGDWESGTRLLKPLEKGIYIDLLMLYYSSERPLIRTNFERITRGYTAEEKEAFDYVISSFFEEREDGFHNTRCDEEIRKAAEKSEKARKSIQARWNKAAKAPRSGNANTDSSTDVAPNVLANEIRTNNERNTDVLLTKNQEPITNKETERKKKEKRQAITHTFNLDLLPSDWLDYCKQVRPDLDPQTVFADFAFYFTKGKGQGELRSDKGWAQSWQGWIRRQKEVRTVKPMQQTSFADLDYSEGINPDGTF